jgi:hypothetical protein
MTFTTVLTIVCISQYAAASKDLDEHVKKLSKALGNVLTVDSSNSVATSIDRVINQFNEVFMFLKKHHLSHTFGDLRASEDLRKAIED